MLKRNLMMASMAVVATLSTSGPVLAETTLKLGHYFAVADFRGKTAQYFADAMAAKTDEVKIDVYPNESLVKGREALQALSQGVVDVYSVYAGYVSGQAPIVNGFSLPFPPPAYDDAAMFELARDPETVKVLDETFARFGVKYLGAINSSGPVQMFFRGEVASVDDIAGKKVRGAGGLSDKALAELGASVTMLSAAEQFLALQTGTVDGISTTWSSYANYGLAEVAPTYLAATVVRAPYLLLMNKAKYDGLSDAAKAAITEAVKETATWSEENFAEEQNMLLEKVKAEAKTTVEVTTEQNARLREKMKPIYDGFVEENGEAAAALMQRWEEVVSKGQ